MVRKRKNIVTLHARYNKTLRAAEQTNGVIEDKQIHTTHMVSFIFVLNLRISTFEYKITNWCDQIVVIRIFLSRFVSSIYFLQLFDTPSSVTLNNYIYNFIAL